MIRPKKPAIESASMSTRTTTKQQLEAAVREVGTNAEDVAIELGK